MPAAMPCRIPGCTRKLWKVRFCQPHFRTAPVEPGEPVCEQGCGRRIFCRGLCLPHHIKRWFKTTDKGRANRRRQKQTPRAKERSKATYARWAERRRNSPEAVAAKQAREAAKAARAAARAAEVAAAGGEREWERAKRRAWLADPANRERRRESERRSTRHDKRRAREALAGEAITPRDRQILCAAFRGACAYCSTKLDRRTLTWDHVVPVVLGAALSWDNAVPCCRFCNTSKCDKDADIWMVARGFDRDRFYTTWERALVELEPLGERVRTPPRPRRKRRQYGPGPCPIAGPPAPCRFRGCDKPTRTTYSASRLCGKHEEQQRRARRAIESGRTPAWIRIAMKRETLTTAAARLLAQGMTTRDIATQIGVPRRSLYYTAGQILRRPPACHCAAGKLFAKGVCQPCYRRRFWQPKVRSA